MSKANLLSKYFKIDDDGEALNFIFERNDVYLLIPQIARSIKETFDNDANLSLSLFQEGDDWKTLFICIQTSKSWESAKRFERDQWDYLFTNYPEVAKNINFEFIYDAI